MLGQSPARSQSPDRTECLQKYFSHLKSYYKLKKQHKRLKKKAVYFFKSRLTKKLFLGWKASHERTKFILQRLSLLAGVFAKV